MVGSRKRVLVAELSDVMAFGVLRRLYEHNQSFDVLLSRTRDVTQQLLESERLSVVAVRATLAKPADLAEVRASAQHSLETRFVAVADLATSQTPNSLYAAGADVVVRSSADSKVLAEVIKTAVEMRSDLNGSLEQLGVAELVQMLCMARRSAMIRVVGEVDGGAIWIGQGEVQHAVYQSDAGEPAMAELLKKSRGKFSVFGNSTAPVQSITKAWQHVLLDAARMEDEATGIHPRQAPDKSGEHPVHKSKAGGHAAAAQQYRALTEAGFQSLRSGDLNKAREYWDAARALGDPLEPSADEEDEEELTSPHLDAVAKPVGAAG